MKKLIEFPLEDGTFMLVEIDADEAEENQWVPASRWGHTSLNLPAKAALTFEAAMEKVKPAAAAIVKNLRELSDPPDEMKVEFGLKLSAEAGAFIAAAGIEANYTVSLTWKRDTKENKP